MLQEILRHWLVIQAIGVLALPLSGLLFRSLPDRGYAFAKSLGLLVVGYGAWLIAMLGLAPFSGPLLAAMALAMAGAGWWLWRRRSAGPLLAQLLPSRWTIIGYEALFLGAMCAAAWLRAHEPVPWGTERPMDFAFFNAIQRSPSFPPADPWLAGYSINYYYFGYLLMAAVNLLADQAPAVGYNLSLALIVGLTALGVAGLVVNLIRLTVDGGGWTVDGGKQSADSRTEAAKAGAPSTVHRPPSLLQPLFALLGVVFVLLAGNQAGALQVIVGSEQVVALDGPQLASAVGQALGGASEITLPSPALTDDFGTITTLTRADKWADFNWWWPSRALWDEYPAREGAPVERRYTITEFPFFSFRLGDMHPHVMALPFGLLALALAMATVARRAAPSYAANRTGWAELLLTGLILGSLYMINSWDLPTYVLLFVASMWLLYARLADDGPLLWRLLLNQLGLVAACAITLFLPFFLTFRSLVGGAEPLINLPLLGGLSRTLGLYIAERSGLHSFVIIFGLFAVPIVGFIYLVQATVDGGRWAVDGSARPSPAALGFAAGRLATIYRLPSTVLLSWLPPGLLIIGLLAGFPLLALAGLGAFALQGAWRLRERQAESFALLAAALGCAICFGTEVLYIRDSFEGWSQRFNTIFKFYYQVWLIWGGLAAYTLWWLLTQPSGWRRWSAYGLAALSGLLLAGALVYPYLSLREIGRGELQSLDGRTPRELSEAGRASIAWLRQSAVPGGVVLEAVEGTRSNGNRYGGSYNGEGYSGVAVISGLPTVVGWLGHESQWRGGDATARNELEPRRSDVERIYTTFDLNEARTLLEKYNVRYVYIGGLERSVYPAEALVKFDQLGQRVFYQDEVVIIEVGE